MRDNAWIVVKVGGSLFDLPDLRARLRDFLATLEDANVLLVPGGGAMADAVRAFDRVHRLGEEASHWLAIQAMSLNGWFLQSLLPESRMVDGIGSLAYASGSDASRWRVLDAFPFFLADDMRPDHLPHCWQVTSDSLAARAAVLAQACELILLKSSGWVGTDWEAAARRWRRRWLLRGNRSTGAALPARAGH